MNATTAAAPAVNPNRPRALTADMARHLGDDMLADWLRNTNRAMARADDHEAILTLRENERVIWAEMQGRHVRAGRL